MAIVCSLHLKMLQCFYSFFIFHFIQIDSVPQSYPTLNVKTLNKITNWMHTDPKQLITIKFGRLIYGQDIRCLRYSDHLLNFPISDPDMELQQFWLNDQIVNHYMDLLVHHSRSNKNCQMSHTMTSYFWTMLNDWGYVRARSVAGNVDIFKFDVVIIPISSDAHWCLAVIYPKRREIKYFDSLGSCNADNETVLTKLANYIKSECLEQHGGELDMSRWIKKTVQEIPRQQNGHDCGVFVCAYAESIVRNRPNFNFTQKHMPYFRNKIAYEIVTGEILK